ncbi:hypothetical protein L2E82_28640 [Cichorium intybus]|uniref:Uncharacterized protein n=1 Tax=Cichorium intybus TaxID=13427 RepID=A0ACB9CWQ1_CICIN|nr:hypothetical protein L2E82_28640 [Cichorium intybus]
MNLQNWVESYVACELQRVDFDKPMAKCFCEEENMANAFESALTAHGSISGEGQTPLLHSISTAPLNLRLSLSTYEFDLFFPDEDSFPFECKIRGTEDEEVEGMLLSSQSFNSIINGRLQFRLCIGKSSFLLHHNGFHIVVDAGNGAGGFFAIHSSFSRTRFCD